MSRLERGQVGEAEYTNAELLTAIAQITDSDPLWLLFGDEAVLTAATRAPGSLLFRGTTCRPSAAAPRVGTWEWSLGDELATWSLDTCRIFGSDGLVPPSPIDAVLEWIHPDDRRLVRTMQETRLRNAEPHEFDARLLQPSGAIRVFRARGTPLHDAAGRPDVMVGTIRDISDELLPPIRP